MDLFNKEKINKLEKSNIKLLQELKKCKDKLSFKEYNNLLAKKENNLNNISSQIKSITKEKDLLSSQLQELYKDEIIDISEIQYMCDFNSEYKRKIDDIRQKQKNIDNVVIMTREFNNYITTDVGLVNSIYKSLAKMMQSNFDIKCDEIMEKITYNSKNILSEKIYNLAKRIEKQGDILGLAFNKKYIDLKVDEIYMVFEYKCKLQLEKEEHNREQEILKDQSKADKEIQKQLEKDEKQLNDLKYKYNKLVKENKDIGDLQERINTLQDCVDLDNRRLTERKSGYVYVVGNRDMKDGLLKIGITKRNIETRMKEIGGAGHSFPMEVYGYVFVDDCYGIEAKLHRYFADSRLNVLGIHKEWFIADLDEVKQAFKEVCNIDIELSEKPCEDYLVSAEKFLDFY